MSCWPARQEDRDKTGSRSRTSCISTRYWLFAIRYSSPIRRVEGEVAGDVALPAVAVGEQLVFVVIELVARFGGELEVRPLDDGVDRAGFLAKAAIDALHHVEVVAHS